MDEELLTLKNKLFQIQKIYIHINSIDIEGSPIDARDIGISCYIYIYIYIELLGIDEGLRIDEKCGEQAGTSGIGFQPIGEDIEEDIDGEKLLESEMYLLDGHQNEISFVVTI